MLVPGEELLERGLRGRFLGGGLEGLEGKMGRYCGG